MRKIYILVLILFILPLFGCNQNINSNIYISSIGLEIKDDKLITYFLSNPLTNISRGDGKEEKDKTEYIKVETTSVYDAFIEAEKSLLFPLNYRHIKSVIFHKDVFKTSYINEFLEFMKSVKFVSFNYYVFSTRSKLEELYEFSTPEQISYQYSVLSSPDLLNFHQYGTEKLHFLDFADSYYVDNRYLHIPLLAVNKTWKDKTTIEVEGFLNAKKCDVFLSKDYPGMLYLYENEALTISTSNSIYTATNYRVSKSIIDNIYTIVVDYTNLLINGEGSEEEFTDYIKKEISTYFADYIEKEGGLYMIKLYNYLNKKTLNLFEYKIEC